MDEDIKKAVASAFAVFVLSVGGAAVGAHNYVNNSPVKFDPGMRERFFWVSTANIGVYSALGGLAGLGLINLLWPANKRKAKDEQRQTALQISQQLLAAGQISPETHGELLAALQQEAS